MSSRGERWFEQRFVENCVLKSSLAFLKRFDAWIFLPPERWGEYFSGRSTEQSGCLGQDNQSAARKWRAENCALDNMKNNYLRFPFALAACRCMSRRCLKSNWLKQCEFSWEKKVPWIYKPINRVVCVAMWWISERNCFCGVWKESFFELAIFESKFTSFLNVHVPNHCCSNRNSIF